MSISPCREPPARSTGLIGQERRDDTHDTLHTNNTQTQAHTLTLYIYILSVRCDMRSKTVYVCISVMHIHHILHAECI